MVDDRGGGAFDERAALDELERFRQEIQREQARRRAVSDEFDAFIRSFKGPAKPPAPPAVPGVPAAPPQLPAAPHQIPAATRPPSALPPPPAAALSPPPAPTLPPAAALPPLPARPLAARAPEPPRIELPRNPGAQAAEPAFDAEFAQAAPSAAPLPAARRRPAFIAPLLALVLVAAGAAWWLLRPAAPAAPPDAAPAVSSPEAASPATPPAGDATPAPGAVVPAPAPAVPPAPAAELTTSRTVWVRVIVDGERVLERELPANARIPLTPAKTIVIRTGDAGAVRLTIAGADQGPLGREGQVVTRTFTLPDHR